LGFNRDFPVTRDSNDGDDVVDVAAFVATFCCNQRHYHQRSFIGTITIITAILTTTKQVML
jgi:hypothetical protein